MIEIEAYILIGGKSMRFGRDKATFELDGEMLAERASRIARTALALSQVTFVAADLDQFPSWRNDNLVADFYPNRGPAGAIHAALTNAATAWIFVLGADLPFVTAEFLSNLRSEISDGFDSVVPLQEDGLPQPLCAFYRVAACRDVFGEAARKEGKLPPIREIIGALNTRYVRVDEYSHLADSARLLRNVNSPSDLPDI